MAKGGTKVSIDKLADAIQDALGEYADYIGKTAIVTAVDKTAAETAEIIAGSAPVRSGRYKRTITWGDKRSKGNTYSATTYADAPKYRLTHLLENGHALKNGGRVKAFPHWKTGENGIPERLISNLKEVLDK